MKKRWIIGLVLLFAGTAFAQNEVTIPYNEFKELYSESLKTKWDEEHAADPFVYSVDHAAYTMNLTRDGALCDAVIKGAVISGKPEPISLFNDRVIIKNIAQVTGGALLCNQGQKAGVSFLPSHEEPFGIHVSFFVPAAEDNRSGFVATDIPSALTNSLTLKTAARLTVTEVPGIKDGDGLYHFSSRSSLEIRFAESVNEKKEDKAKTESLSIRYKTVSTPPMVLDALYCYTSFEENGNALTVINMTLPPEAGESLKIKSVPHADIWSFRVNGKKMKVFESKEKDTFWILPLAKDKASEVELALLTRGEKMGLSGRLEWALPQMEFPTRTVNVAFGLPERVELTAFEGPVSPASPFKRSRPKEFIGKPYYFSQSFYKGEGITLAVSYKEPVK